LILSKKQHRQADHDGTPAMNPTRMAVVGLMTSAPAVMPTRPAKMPLSAIERSGFFELTKL
jgi:hypothetical protein